jgi:urea transport system permease protein
MSMRNFWLVFWLAMLASLTLVLAGRVLAADQPVAAPAAPAAPAAATDPAALDALLKQLPAADYSTKQDLIHSIAEVKSPQSRVVLTALFEGRLYARDSDGTVLVTDVADSPFSIASASTGETLGKSDGDGLTKIGVNNQLRRQLRAVVAQFDLVSPDAAVRLAAVKEMLRAPDEQSTAALRSQLVLEKDAAVRSAIQAGLAVAALDSDDAAVRLGAVRELKGSLNTEVYNRLTALVDSETDSGVKKAAMDTLRGIDRWRNFYSGIQTLMFGLSLGSVLVLAAIGLAITFGVMGVINMAHGELMMLGAYATYVVQLLMPNHIGASILVAIPVAFIVSGLMGVLIERGIVRVDYGPPRETLLATFGVSLILQQAVRDIFTANNRPVETPAWLAGSLQINDVLSITYNRLYIVLFTFAVFMILLMVLKRTRLGLEVRAVSQNRAMAKAMGIRTEWVDAMTFGLGSGIAGVAGVALSQLTNVGPNLGQSYIVDSFMVVVFGGVGNLWGTQLGGTALGVINKLLEPFAGAVLAKILVLVFLILFIQRRPRGLFPQKGRAAEG